MAQHCYNYWKIRNRHSTTSIYVCYLTWIIFSLSLSLSETPFLLLLPLFISHITPLFLTSISLFVVVVFSFGSSAFQVKSQRSKFQVCFFLFFFLLGLFCFYFYFYVPFSFWVFVECFLWFAVGFCRRGILFYFLGGIFFFLLHCCSRKLMSLCFLFSWKKNWKFG